MKKILIICFIIIFLFSLIYALKFDIIDLSPKLKNNDTSFIKEYNQTENKIYIKFDTKTKNETLTEITLLDNTYYCNENCYFILNISNADKLKFKESDKDKIGIYSTKDYFYVDYNKYVFALGLKEVNYFISYDSQNYTLINDFSDIKDLNGSFYLKAEGLKYNHKNNNIEWIPSFYGIDINEWAYWNSWQDWNDDFEDNIFNTTLFDNRSQSCGFGPIIYSYSLLENSGSINAIDSFNTQGAGYWALTMRNIWAKQDFNDERDYIIKLDINRSISAISLSSVFRFYINNGSYIQTDVSGACDSITASGVLLKELSYNQLSEYGGIFNITLNSTTATLTTFNNTILNSSADISSLILRYVLIEANTIKCIDCERGYILNIYNFTVYSPDILNINLITPLNNTNYPETINFNCNVSTTGNSLKNMTMFIWNSTGIYNNTLSKQITGLSNSTNNTLTFTQAGTYYFNCLVFNSNNFSIFNSQNNTFFVSIGNPSINLNYPTNSKSFNNGTNIYFNFTALDIDGLSACELWSNWTGNWIRNYTWVSPTNNTMNYTIVNLSNDGHFIWNIWCNDTSNNFGFSNSNYTLTIDTLEPSQIINSITTTAGSQTITMNTTETDINLNSCKYSIFNSTNGIDGTNNNVSYTCGNSQTRTATVSAYSTYNLTIYANDLAGNENSTTLSFTTSESSGGTTGGGGGTVEKVYIIALVKPFNSSLQLTDLQRAIVYKEINEIKKLVFGTFAVALTDQDLSDLKERLQNKGITMSSEEVILWVEQYEAGKIDKVFLDKKYVDQFGLVLATGTYCGDGICQSENDLGMKEGPFNCNQDCPGADVDSATINCFDNNPDTKCIWANVTYQYAGLFLGIIVLILLFSTVKDKTGQQIPLHKYYRIKLKRKRFK